MSNPEGDDRQSLLDAAYAVKTPDDNRRLYRAWAETYESDFVEGGDYIYHRQVADVFVAGYDDEFDKTPGPVLDVGCGTGILGEQLRASGVTIIDGIDISPEMLTVAGGKADEAGPIYRNLIEADLTNRIALADATYLGVVSSGAFTHGHLGPETLDELIRIGATGARYAIGINAAHFDSDGFGAHLDRLVDVGRITAYTTVDAPIYGDSTDGDPDQTAKVTVFNRT